MQKVAPATRNIPRPSSRWIGVYQNVDLVGIVCIGCKRDIFLAPGQLVRNCCFTHPSKDIAESEGWATEQHFDHRLLFLRAEEAP